MGVWLKVGGRYESAVNKGISHYMEHLAFKGTKKYSCRRIKESIEGVGGSLNGFTSEELTCYLAKMPVRHLDTALNILSDMVNSPLLLESDIEKERTVILEEIKMYMDLPHSYVHELLDDLLWPNQPLGMSIAGSAETVQALKRKDIVLFKNSYYVPSNIVVSAAGVLEHEKFIRKVEKIFAPLKKGSASAFQAVKENQVSANLKVLDKDTEQTHLAMGFHAFKRDDPMRYALGLLHVILGANMSSRLFNEVREKRGLAYEIGTQVKRFHDTGAFVVHAGIDNRKVNDALELILKELSRVRKTLVTEDELKRAKDFSIGQLMLSLEDTLDNMLMIGENTATLDRIYTFEEIAKGINRVSLRDIREAAMSIFKESSLNLALIGPVKDSRDTIYKQLHL